MQGNPRQFKAWASLPIDISRVGGVYPCLFKTDGTGLILGATVGGLVDLDMDALLEGGVLGSLISPMLGFLRI